MIKSSNNQGSGRYNVYLFGASSIVNPRPGNEFSVIKTISNNYESFKFLRFSYCSKHRNDCNKYE